MLTISTIHEIILYEVIILKTLGNRLKERRKELKMTQENLSDLLNINRVTYQGYESDRHKPDVDTLVKLADVLHTSTDFLLGRYDN